MASLVAASMLALGVATAPAAAAPVAKVIGLASNGTAVCALTTTATSTAHVVYCWAGATPAVPVRVHGLPTDLIRITGGAMYGTGRGGMFCGQAAAGIYCWGRTVPLASPAAPVRLASPAQFVAQHLPGSAGEYDATVGGLGVCAIRPGSRAVVCQGAVTTIGTAEVGVHNRPATMPGLLNIRALATDGTSYCALATSRVYCWSQDGRRHGQSNGYAPNPAPIRHLPAKITSLVGGPAGYCALAKSHAYCWAANASPALLSGKTASVIAIAPTEVGWCWSFMLDIACSPFTQASWHLSYQLGSSEQLPLGATAASIACSSTAAKTLCWQPSKTLSISCVTYAAAIVCLAPTGKPAWKVPGLGGLAPSAP